MNSKMQNLMRNLIIVIILFGSWWVWRGQAYSEPLEKTFPHGLIVASHNVLVNLVYNPSKQTYEKQGEIILPDRLTKPLRGFTKIIGIVSCDNYIFVSTEYEVLKINGKFEKIGTKKFEKIGALATDNKSIFISAENSFIALDKNLRELNRVELGKNAHDILIYRDTAYLLDDMMIPFFLFRVNIENPKNIQIKQKIEFTDINAHLYTQWLNPGLDQWAVLYEYGHRGGYGQVILVYSINDGNEPLAGQKTFSCRRIPEVKMEGLSIRGITNLPPIWAIVRDVKDKYYLAQISSENNKIAFLKLLELTDIATDEKIIIKRREDYLFIASDAYLARPQIATLKIINVREPTEIIHSEDLRKFNVFSVINILPY